MVPRFITKIEEKYHEKFPNNPATIFYPAGTDKEEAFKVLLNKAVKDNTPLTENDLEHFFGKDSYNFLKEWYAQWYGKIVWK